MIPCWQWLKMNPSSLFLVFRPQKSPGQAGLSKQQNRPLIAQSEGYHSARAPTAPPNPTPTPCRFLLRRALMISNRPLPTFSNRPCLAENNAVEMTRFLKSFTTALDQDVIFRRETTANKQSSRGSEAGTTRTGHHKNGDCELQRPKQPSTDAIVYPVLGQPARDTETQPDNPIQDSD